MNLESQIKSLGKETGFDLVGISKLDRSQYKDKIEDWIEKERHGEMSWYEKNLDRRVEPNKHLYNKAVSAITLGLYYRPAEISEELKNDPSRGLIARYARYDDYHKIMEVMLKELTAKLNNIIKDGWQYQVYVDTGPVLEREVGAKGGLGFIGKNTTLISPSLGSYFFLAEIICDLDLKPDKVNNQGTCGQCQRCLKACPTKAIISPHELDARLCISYLTIENKGSILEDLRPLIGNWIYGCDICQEVCPWNKRLPAGLVSRLKLRSELVAPRLLDLVKLSEVSFKSYFSKTPVLRAKYRGFMRNVLVAIGNWGNKEALSYVNKLLNQKDELISEHARWARQQIDIKNK